VASPEHSSIHHFSPPGAVYFVTTSTFDHFVLPNDARRITLECIIHNATRNCRLFATVVMPDHFHILLKPSQDEAGEWIKLSRIMNVIKGYSSHKIKELLGRKEPVWLRGYYDRAVRDSNDMSEYHKYIELNPVRAGLVERWREYAYIWTWEMEMPKERPRLGAVQEQDYPAHSNSVAT